MHIDRVLVVKMSLQQNLLPKLKTDTRMKEYSDQHFHLKIQ